MKLKNHLSILLITLIFISCHLSSGHGENPEPAAPLLLTIQSDKKIYKTEENIVIHLTLMNPGNYGPLRVIDFYRVTLMKPGSYGPLQVIDFDRRKDGLFSTGVELQIKDGAGNVIPHTGEILDRNNSVGTWLNPHEKQEINFVVNNKKAKSYYPIDKPSHYQISAIYSDSFEYKDYTGIIKNKLAYSIPITIEVK